MQVFGLIITNLVFLWGIRITTASDGVTTLLLPPNDEAEVGQWLITMKIDSITLDEAIKTNKFRAKMMKISKIFRKTLSPPNRKMFFFKNITSKRPDCDCECYNLHSPESTEEKSAMDAWLTVMQPLKKTSRFKKTSVYLLPPSTFIEDYLPLDITTTTTTKTSTDVSSTVLQLSTTSSDANLTPLSTYVRKYLTPKKFVGLTYLPQPTVYRETTSPTFIFTQDHTDSNFSISYNFSYIPSDYKLDYKPRTSHYISTTTGRYENEIPKNRT